MLHNQLSQLSCSTQIRIGRLQDSDLRHDEYVAFLGREGGKLMYCTAEFIARQEHIS